MDRPILYATTAGLIILLASCAGTIESRAIRTVGAPNPAARRDASSIRIYRLKPVRPYKEVGIVEATGMAANAYLKEALREEAAVLGADAIIGLSASSHVGEGSCVVESVPEAKGSAISFVPEDTQPLAPEKIRPIKILSQKPKHPYKTLGTVAISGLNTRMDIKDRLREQARSLGADAIIDFTITTEIKDSSCTFESVPTLKGTAITFLPDKEVKTTKVE